MTDRLMQSPAKQIIDIARLLDLLTPEERQEIAKEVTGQLPIWTPLPGPQDEAYKSKADVLFFGGQAGGSKMLSIDTPVPTPLGWTTMGEIKDGDIVFSEKGEPIKVLQAHSILIPEVSYRVRFDDKTEVNACSDHKWVTLNERELVALTARDPGWQERRRKKRESRRQLHTSECKYRSLLAHNVKIASAMNRLPLPGGTVRTTQEIFETIKVYHGGKPRTNHAIPVSLPLNLPYIGLPIDPYLLGLWLGDGTSLQAAITTADKEIVNYIRGMGYECKKRPGDKYAYGINRGFKGQLRQMGLLGNKHIPGIYLRASYDQRLALLQGLMDTDGTASKDDGQIMFNNTRWEIIHGIQDLIVSLGWKAFITQRRARLYGKDCGVVWKVAFAPSEYVFRLSRKRGLQRLSTRRTTKFRYIVSCERIDSVPMRCLTVDNPTGQYLVSRSMIPTHNTDLIIGLSLTAHRRSIIFRREATQTVAIVDRIAEILRTRVGWNSQHLIWRLRNRQIEIGSCPFLGDEMRYSGRPHDLLAMDEATLFNFSQFRFLSTWARTTLPNQRVRIICTGNPPQTEEGRWVIEYWAPWLDPKHPKPAEPGELRWYTTIDGKDVEVESGKSFEHNGELLTPKSRTFIPSSVDDNPFLLQTGYKSTLQALPEPLRSQMLLGDFRVGIRDSEWQVIPTSWVEEAQARWTTEGKKGQMESVGVDPSRGGADQFCIATRYGTWYDKVRAYPGKDVPDGPTGAGLVLAALKDNAPVHVDIIGIGSSTYDHLHGNNIHVVAVNSSEAAPEGATDKSSGKLKFRNMRAYLWWRFREKLDPSSGENVALPPDPELKADLCAPLWMLTPGGIMIESKEDKLGAGGVRTAGLKRRLGRSPGKGEAVIYCSAATIKKSQFKDLPKPVNLAKTYAVKLDLEKKWSM